MSGKLAGWLLLALLSASFFSCKKMPFFAVDGATLIISADKSFLKAGGEKAVVTVIGFNEAGEPLHDHTLVTFTATLGTIPTSVEMMAGQVTVEFVSGKQNGVAEITARSGKIEATPAPLEIAVGLGALESLTLHADPARLGTGGGQSRMTVYAFDAAMNPLAAIPVILSTSAGELDKGNAIRYTDENGKISEYLYTEKSATVRAESGGKKAEIEVTVNENQSPRADFSVSPSKVKVGETIYFDGSLSSDPDGRIVNWEWNFGDGTNDWGENANHAFAAAGTYTITLKVTDNDGGNSACPKPVTITK